MSDKDRIWREGDPVWTWPEGETVPRWKWMQIPQSEVVRLLNLHIPKPTGETRIKPQVEE